MVTVSLAHAKAHLSELLDKVEDGEEIVITRHGAAIAHLSAIRKPPRPLRPLSEFRARQPAWSGPSASLLRDARDEDL